MTTLEQLLMALNGGNNPTLPNLPAPARPMPLTTIGQPQPGAMLAPPLGPPDLPPAPPQQPLDTGLANSYLQFLSPAPTPPAPLSRGQRVANALMGFSAGVQGNGPQFLEQLQRPQREYEQQVQARNNQRTQLGVMGLNAAQEKQQRQQDVTFRRAEMQATRDFQDYMRRSGVTDDLAKMQLEQGFQLEMENRRQQFLTAQALQKEQADREAKARLHERELIDKDFYPAPIAKSIARYTAGLEVELSPAARQFQSVRARKLQAQSDEIQMKIRRLNAGGGKAPANNVDIVGPDGGVLMTVPYRQLKLDRFGAPRGFPEGSKIRPTTQPQSGGALALNPQQQNLYNQTKQQHPEANDAQIRDYMRRKGWLQ